MTDPSLLESSVRSSNRNQRASFNSFGFTRNILTYRHLHQVDCHYDMLPLHMILPHDPTIVAT